MGIVQQNSPRRRGQAAQGGPGDRARGQRARARDRAPDRRAARPPRPATSSSRSTGARSRPRIPSTARSSSPTSLDDLLPEAFAVVREAGRRVLGQRHFDVQVMGGAALHLGWVAEMKTGEGKTLVATLPSYLNALAGRGVHLVTVNDYLARCDAEWMGRLHRFLGLDGRHRRPRRLDARRRSARSTTATSPTARTTSSASTTSATTWSSTSTTRCSAAHAQPVVVAALLRDRRRGRLDPHRRGPHAAHHLRARRRRGRALLPVRPDRRGACNATATTRSTKPSAPSCRPRRASHASRRRSASRTSTRTSTRTTCTSCSRRCGARSCSSATSTTSCRTAR